MRKLFYLDVSFVALLLACSLSTSVQAGPENSPMAACLQCGQALLTCTQGVLTEFQQNIITCGGDTACIDGYGTISSTGIDACKTSYEACQADLCTLPDNRP
jgi:hypothetical protein